MPEKLFPPSTQINDILRDELMLRGAVDVVGPLRVALFGQHEVLIDEHRLLLVGRTQFDEYGRVLIQAGVDHLTEVPEYSNPDTIAVDVPRSARTIHQVIGSYHADTEKILDGVFNKSGTLARMLGEKSGLLPSPKSFRFRDILSLRKLGNVTLIPPVQFVEYTPESRDDLFEQVRAELEAKKDINTDSLELSLRRGLYGVSAA